MNEFVAWRLQKTEGPGYSEVVRNFQQRFI